MTFQDSIHTVLAKKYATFTGRASRSEFWWFWLASVLVSVVFSLMGWVTGFVDAFDSMDSLVSLAILIPTLAVTCRRLHDTERSGWWQALPIGPAMLAGLLFGANGTALAWVLIAITVIAFIVLIAWLATIGTPGPNRYGEDPLKPETDADIFD